MERLKYCHSISFAGKFPLLVRQVIAGIVDQDRLLPIVGYSQVSPNTLLLPHFERGARENGVTILHRKNWRPILGYDGFFISTEDVEQFALAVGLKIIIGPPAVVP